jgi:hypothetical protein
MFHRSLFAGKNCRHAAIGVAMISCFSGGVFAETAS